MMFTAALRMRSTSATDGMVEALDCEAFRVDWYRGKE
jgi:hypothetical protein